MRGLMKVGEEEASSSQLLFFIRAKKITTKGVMALDLKIVLKCEIESPYNVYSYVHIVYIIYICLA